MRSTSSLARGAVTVLRASAQQRAVGPVVRRLPLTVPPPVAPCCLPRRVLRAPRRERKVGNTRSARIRHHLHAMWKRRTRVVQTVSATRFAQLTGRLPRAPAHLGAPPRLPRTRAAWRRGRAATRSRTCARVVAVRHAATVGVPLAEAIARTTAAPRRLARRPRPRRSPRSSTSAGPGRRAVGARAAARRVRQRGAARHPGRAACRRRATEAVPAFAGTPCESALLPGSSPPRPAPSRPTTRVGRAHAPHRAVGRCSASRPRRAPRPGRHARPRGRRRARGARGARRPRSASSRSCAHRTRATRAGSRRSRQLAAAIQAEPEPAAAMTRAST